MPSPERLRGPVVALVVTGVLLVGIGAWAFVARSTLPLSLDGTVTSVEVRHEKHPGVDDVWMVALDDGPPRHLDRRVARLLEPGDEVRKDRWSGTVQVAGTTHDVGLSRDARVFLGLSPLLVLATAGLGVLATRRPRRPARADPVTG
ncbi:hypothetical protein [Aeromicrobium sp. IC_218]|uniref:hypothetical protein n=1 Tax=Aeromicrobium sp. IC_218 TaxID=2545468 RepID=UPI00103CA9B1|nr:hypothetical protein [Aeromicrobium sp. IC_218]TCI99765.1 hypothetical protein E0W78_04985 [Aeromicrobium sp. IC_218]